MLKRVLDIAVSAIAIVVLSPLILLLILAVRIFLGSPILFRQLRPGRDGKPFEMMKFRTMLELRGENGELLPDSDRLSPFGRWLRSTSLDEIPEIWNILRGDMSLVGPRPLLMAYLPLYSAKQARRHEVRPGLTGWAQINGRNALQWSEKFELDVWYVDNQSFMLDMKILILTVLRVIKKDGISAAGEATMPAFTGD